MVDAPPSDGARKPYTGSILVVLARVGTLSVRRRMFAVQLLVRSEGFLISATPCHVGQRRIMPDAAHVLLVIQHGGSRSSYAQNLVRIEAEPGDQKAHTVPPTRL